MFETEATHHEEITHEKQKQGKKGRIKNKKEISKTKPLYKVLASLKRHDCECFDTKNTRAKEWIRLLHSIPTLFDAFVDNMLSNLMQYLGQK